MSKEALEKAHAALKRMASYGDTFGYRSNTQSPYVQVCEAIAAIDALAEQPAPVQQEPVAWRTYTGRGYYIIDATLEEAQKNWPDRQHQPLYTSPQRTWVGLTDDRSHQILLDMAKHIETFGDESTTEQALSAECIRFILERVTAHGIKEKA